ncbi:MAG: hypothetical protein HY611_07525 [Elusimicrobia bacterium]|nr:hypothetical protein [Elusimicrobiota bacterium]
MRATEAGVSRSLRAYGWVFLTAGAVFMLFPEPLLQRLYDLAFWLPGARPFGEGSRSLWLCMAGAMMAMIAYLAFALSRDPEQYSAWNTLLLAKAVSTAFFTIFAATERNSLFLIGSAVDGPILSHLWMLRLRQAKAEIGDPGEAWRSRAAGRNPCRHEVWFVKINDPVTRNALWVRYTIDGDQPTLKTALWYSIFDSERQEVLSGRWEEPEGNIELGGKKAVCRFGDSVLERGSARARGPKASWDLSWEDGRSPPFRFVPEALVAAGLAGVVYDSVLSSARFRGEFRLGDRLYSFAGAAGSVGHLWGGRMGDNWRWAHAVFPAASEGKTAVFEILSARSRLGPFTGPRCTAAHLWFEGKHYVSIGLSAARRNAVFGGPAGWGFRVHFGKMIAEGRCRPQEVMTADIPYAGTDGAKLNCSNCTAGELRLSLRTLEGGFIAEFGTRDSAAVETVSPGVSAGCLQAFALAYARHIQAGANADELRERLERRLTLLPVWARWLAWSGAFAMRWMLPALLLKRARRFESLDETEAEEFLLRLQCSGNPAIKVLFLSVKSLLLPACYGGCGRLEKMGFLGQGRR